MKAELMWQKVFFVEKREGEGRFFKAEVSYQYGAGTYAWEISEVDTPKNKDTDVFYYGNASSKDEAVRAVINVESYLNKEADNLDNVLYEALNGFEPSDSLADLS